MQKVGSKTWFKIKEVKEKDNFYFSPPKKKGFFLIEKWNQHSLHYWLQVYNHSTNHFRIIIPIIILQSPKNFILIVFLPIFSTSFATILRLHFSETKSHNLLLYKIIISAHPPQHPYIWHPFKLFLIKKPNTPDNLTVSFPTHSLSLPNQTQFSKSFFSCYSVITQRAWPFINTTQNQQTLLHSISLQNQTHSSQCTSPFSFSFSFSYLHSSSFHIQPQF